MKNKPCKIISQFPLLHMLVQMLSQSNLILVQAMTNMTLDSRILHVQCHKMSFDVVLAEACLLATHETHPGILLSVKANPTIHFALK